MATPLPSCQYFLNHELTPVVVRTTTTPHCPICDEPAIDPVSLPCGHVFCRECITQWLVGPPEHNTCPLCRRELFRRRLMVRLPLPAAMQRASGRAQMGAEGTVEREFTEALRAARTVERIRARVRVIEANRRAQEAAANAAAQAALGPAPPRSRAARVVISAREFLRRARRDRRGGRRQ